MDYELTSLDAEMKRLHSAGVGPVRISMQAESLCYTCSKQIVIEDL